MMPVHRSLLLVAWPSVAITHFYVYCSLHVIVHVHHRFVGIHMTLWFTKYGDDLVKQA